MTPSISGALSTQPVETPAAPPASAQQAPQTQSSTDTVELSESAKINQLFMLGLSPQEIADNLDVEESIVSSDLGIVSTIIA